MNGIRLTAFANNIIIDNQEFLVFDTDCNYDVILGGSFLQQIGANLNYSDLELEWLGNTIPMASLIGSRVVSRAMLIHSEDIRPDADSYAAYILNAKYDKKDIANGIEDNSCLPEVPKASPIP